MNSYRLLFKNLVKKIFFLNLVFLISFSSIFAGVTTVVDQMQLKVWKGSATTIQAVISDWTTRCTNTNICSYALSNLWSTICQYEGDIYFHWRFYEDTGLQYVYTYPNNSSVWSGSPLSLGTTPLGSYYMTVNWDSNQAHCQCIGKTWFSNLGSFSGVNSACCGDDGGNDNFATFSGSLTTSTSVQCRRCKAGVDQGTVTLYGNGYWTGTTCYFGNIVCDYNSGAHGVSATLPCSSAYCLSSDICYYNVQCYDGGYGWQSVPCPNTMFSGGICYYNRECISIGCNHKDQNRPPNVPSSVSVNPNCAGASTSVTVSATVSDIDGDQVRLQVCKDSICSQVLCTSGAVSSGSVASCQFTASSACSSTGSCTIYVRTIENSADPCGQIKASSTVSASFNYDITGPNAPSGLNPASNSWVNTGTPTLSWSATTDVGCAGLNRYEVYVYSSTDCSGAVVRSNTALTATSWQVSPGLSDGTYSWRVRAVDNLGNVGGFSGCNIIKIDTIAPTTTINPNGGGWSNSDFSVSLSCSDGSGSGCQATYYKIINEGESCGSTGFSTYSGAFSVSCGAGSVCRKLVCYYSVDNAGNVESTKVSNIFYIDKQLPTGTVDYPNTIYTITPVRVYVSSNDFSGSGVATAQLQYSTATLNADDSCGTFGSWTNVGNTDPGKTYVDVTLTTNLCYQFRYVVTDGVGWQYIATSSAILKVRLNHPDYYCGLKFIDPSYYITTTSGIVVGRIDNNGNFFFRGTAVFNNVNFPTPNNAFIIQNPSGTILYYFNATLGQFRGSLFTQQSTVPAEDGGDLLIRTASGTRVAIFTDSGNAYIKGNAVYHGAPGLCPATYSCDATKNYNCYK